MDEPEAAADPTAEVLVGVGVGPGDPELLTVKGLRTLQRADLVLVPTMDGAGHGRAEQTVLEYVPEQRVRRLSFALNERHDTARRERSWDAAGAVAAEAFADGARLVAFATIGDPNVYSTFSYLAETVRAMRPGVRIETVPGITAMQDLAARSGTVLCEGTETLVLLPLTGDLAELRSAAETFDNVVIYKTGHRLGAVREVLRDAGRLDTAVYGALLGLPDQVVRPVAEVDADTAPYLATVLVPQVKSGRGARLLRRRSELAEG